MSDRKKLLRRFKYLLVAGGKCSPHTTISAIWDNLKGTNKDKDHSLKVVTQKCPEEFWKEQGL